MEQADLRAPVRAAGLREWPPRQSVSTLSYFLSHLRGHHSRSMLDAVMPIEEEKRSSPVTIDRHDLPE